VKVLIVGASKGIGLATTKAALAAGYEVRAFARSAAAMTLSDPRLEKMPGDATRQQDVEAVLADVDAVIVTLGVGFRDLIKPVHLFSDATRVIVAAMTEKSVKRLVCVTGFGGWRQQGQHRHVATRAVSDRVWPCL